MENQRYESHSFNQDSEPVHICRCKNIFSQFLCTLVPNPKCLAVQTWDRVRAGSSTGYGTRR